MRQALHWARTGALQRATGLSAPSAHHQQALIPCGTHRVPAKHQNQHKAPRQRASVVASAAIGAGADEEDEDLIEEEDATESDQQAEVEEEYWEDEDYSDEEAEEGAEAEDGDLYYFEPASEDADPASDAETDAAFVDDDKLEEPEEPPQDVFENPEAMSILEVEYANYRETLRRRLGVEGERVLVHDLGAYLDAVADRPWIKAMKLRWAATNMERERRQLLQRVQELEAAIVDAAHPFAVTALAGQLADFVAQEQQLCVLEQQARVELQEIEHITEFWTPR